MMGLRYPLDRASLRTPMKMGTTSAYVMTSISSAIQLHLYGHAQQLSPPNDQLQRDATEAALCCGSAVSQQRLDQSVPQKQRRQREAWRQVHEPPNAARRSWASWSQAL